MVEKTRYYEKGSYGAVIICFYCGTSHHYKESDILLFPMVSYAVVCSSCNYATKIYVVPEIVKKRITHKSTSTICDKCNYHDKVAVKNMQLIYHPGDAENRYVSKYRAVFVCRECKYESPRKISNARRKEIEKLPKSCVLFTRCCKKKFYLSESVPYAKKWYGIREYRRYTCEKCNKYTYVHVEEIPKFALQRLQYADEHGVA